MVPREEPDEFPREGVVATLPPRDVPELLPREGMTPALPREEPDVTPAPLNVRADEAAFVPRTLLRCAVDVIPPPLKATLELPTRFPRATPFMAGLLRVL